jgi:hypothetical protein
MNIEELKKNPRTHYLALELERLHAQKSETEALANDPEMAELAKDDLKNISEQITNT